MIFMMWWIGNTAELNTVDSNTHRELKFELWRGSSNYRLYCIQVLFSTFVGFVFFSRPLQSESLCLEILRDFIFQSSRQNNRNSSVAEFYFLSMYSIVFWMPIQQKLAPPVLPFSKLIVYFLLLCSIAQGWHLNRKFQRTSFCCIWFRRDSTSIPSTRPSFWMRGRKTR